MREKPSVKTRSKKPSCIKKGGLKLKKVKYEDIELFKGINFQATEKVEAFDCAKAHERAFEAMEAGFDIQSRDYNIFVVGHTGTGRRTFVKQLVEDIAKEKEIPDDWIYVYNFEDQWSPNAISLKAGTAKRLKKDFEKLLEEILKALDNLFESDVYQEKAQELKAEYDKKQKELWDEITEKAKKLGYALQVAPNGIMTVPLKDGKKLKQEEVNELPEEERKQYEENSQKVKHIVEGYLHRTRLLQNDYQDEVEKLNRESAEFAIKPAFDKIKKTYKAYGDLLDHLDRMQEDILENLSLITGDDEKQATNLFQRYQINVFVDHSNYNGAPRITEINPTYSNLFGKIEYLSKNGYLYTDHTLIKSGSIHRANGGYIVIEAKDLLRDIYVWDTLKKILYSEKITVENIESRTGYSSLATIKPSPIPLDLKVILIGEPHLYDLLYQLDPDFEKLFRIKAEFDYELENKEGNRHLMLNFLHSVVQEKDLMPLDSEAVKEVLAFSVRLSGSRRKLSTHFSRLTDLLIESNRIAEKQQLKQINANIIKETIRIKEKRLSLDMEKIHEMIENNEIIINTAGEKTGETNGLSIISTGDFDFGIPARITADYSVASTGLVDIQREVDMSGKIYKKAVMTLESFFEARYSKKIPLSLKATTSFEQTYGTIDGDSATVAETVALISSISGIGIKQEIAVTGSMSQKGDIQPVGGISEKVEGFYRACKNKGLNGQQGVIVPQGNLDSLILKDEVLKDIQEDNFHLWTVETIDEVIGIMTGKEAGKLNKNGKYTKDSVNYHVMKTLEKAHKISQQEHDSEEKEKKGK